MQIKTTDSKLGLPIVISPDDNASASAGALTDWIASQRGLVEELTHAAGVLLFRGFGLDSPERFHKACAGIRPQLRNYVGGDSPRHVVQDKVYTSTEYPAHIEVLLHNELSYAGWSPERVFFGCMIAAKTGGETPVADGRKIYAKLDPGIRARFEERGLIYKQHLWDASGALGPGKSWQETFECTTRQAAKAYLAKANMQFEWTELGLRTEAKHPAVLRHQVTGEVCWHNQADQWHRELLSAKDSIGATIESSQAGEATLGNHVTFGDGSEIALPDLAHIRAVNRSCAVAKPWQVGDLMVIDNVLAMHGRNSFQGERRVLVALA